MRNSILHLIIFLFFLSCSESEQVDNKSSDLPKVLTIDTVQKTAVKLDSTEIFRLKLIELLNGGEIVIDSTNNLMWMRKDYSYLNNRFLKNWDEGMKWVEEMNQKKHLGFDDWYVPSVKEYKTMNKSGKDRKEYREKFLEIEQKYSWGVGAYSFWASNEKSKYVASYVSFHDGFATSGDKNEQKNAQTGEDFGMSVRLVRKLNR